MSLLLREADLTRFDSALRVLLSPLVYPDADAWRTEASYRLRELFRADHTVFGIPRKDGLDLHSVNMLPEFHRVMAQLVEIRNGKALWADPVLARIEQRRRVERLEAWRMEMLGALLEDSSTLRRSAWHGEVLVPSRVHDSLNLYWELPTGPATLCVSFERRLDPDPVDPANLPVIRMLLPAFKAGVETLLRWEAQRVALAALLDELSEALLVLDGAGRKLHQNAALTRMLADEPEAAYVFAEMRRTALALYHGVAHAGIPTRREVATRTARFRLQASYAVPEAFGEGAVMVSLKRHVERLPGITELQRLWGMTPREAEITLFLAERASNQEIAARLFLSPHTVRHHAERVFAKLGITSRREVRGKLLQSSSV